MMAETRAINPWTWQDAYGFSQAVESRDSRRLLVCSGQTSVDASGAPLHAGDMRAQLRQAFANLRTVLQAAGMDFSHVVRLNYYTTDVAAYLAASDEAEGFLAGITPRPAGTLLGVAALFHPDILVEIEATAVA
jgi:enamine deaminase RidA (YjgF/YER057c/UK114 family)